MLVTVPPPLSKAASSSKSEGGDPAEAEEAVGDVSTGPDAKKEDPTPPRALVPPCLRCAGKGLECVAGHGATAKACRACQNAKASCRFDDSAETEKGSDGEEKKEKKGKKTKKETGAGKPKTSKGKGKEEKEEAEKKEESDGSVQEVPVAGPSSKRRRDATSLGPASPERKRSREVMRLELDIKMGEIEAAGLRRQADEADRYVLGMRKMLEEVENKI